MRLEKEIRIKLKGKI